MIIGTVPESIVERPNNKNEKVSLVLNNVQYGDFLCFDGEITARKSEAATTKKEKAKIDTQFEEFSGTSFRSILNLWAKVADSTKNMHTHSICFWYLITYSLRLDFLPLGVYPFNQLEQKTSG